MIDCRHNVRPRFGEGQQTYPAAKSTRQTAAGRKRRRPQPARLMTAIATARLSVRSPPLPDAFSTCETSAAFHRVVRKSGELSSGTWRQNTFGGAILAGCPGMTAAAGGESQTVAARIRQIGRVSRNDSGCGSGEVRNKHLWALMVLEGDFVRDTWMDRRHRIGFFVKAGAGQPVECLRHTWLRHPVKPANAYRAVFCCGFV